MLPACSRARLAEAVRPLGLAPAQFMVLLELWRDEEGLTQKDLVGRLDVEQATMAATLARMERSGLIERRPDQADARARRIQLTARARALQEPALVAAKSVNARALAGFSEEEREVFTTGMRRIVGALARRRARLDQLLIEEGRAAIAPIGHQRIARDGADFRPAQAIVEPARGSSLVGVEHEEVAPERQHGRLGRASAPRRSPRRRARGCTSTLAISARCG